MKDEIILILNMSNIIINNYNIEELNSNLILKSVKDGRNSY